MYYVIEQSYAGPNRDQHLDSHTFRVQSEPGRGNMSKQPIIEGWLGCTNDWDETAHGEFETLEAAKEAIANLTDGEHRVDELDRYQDSDILYRVRVGRYQPWGKESSENYCYDSMRESITALSTDDEIEQWVDDCSHSAALDADGELDTDAVFEMARQYRDELRKSQ